MISAIILSHNDAGTIANTLKSVAWCKERIVIDDFSSDKTPRIAKKLRAKVYQHHLDGDFAAQRNFGLSKAKGEWVLFVDSDEVVSTALAAEIRLAMAIPETLEKGQKGAPVGYIFRRKDFFGGRWLTHGETSRVRLLRLAKRAAGKWKRAVHETWQVRGYVAELSEPLLHYPHRSVAEFLDEVNRYSTLNAKYFFDHGVRANIFQIIGYPVAKFLVNYIWRGGFADGTPGAIVAIMMSFHSFLTRAKLYMLERTPAKNV